MLREGALLLEGANGGEAVDGLIEVRDDGRLGGQLQALELARGAAKDLLQVVVDDQNGNDGQEEVGRDDDVDDDGREAEEEEAQQHGNGDGQFLKKLIDKYFFVDKPPKQAGIPYQSH